MTAGRRASNARGWGFTAEIDIADRILFGFISLSSITQYVMVNVWVVISWGSCLRQASSCIRLICGPALPALFFCVSARLSGLANLLDRDFCLGYYCFCCAYRFFPVFLSLWSSYFVFVDSSRSSYVFGLITSCSIFLSPSFCGSDGNERPLFFFSSKHVFAIWRFLSNIILFSSIHLVLVVCGSDGNERPLRFFVTYICHLTLFKAGLVCLNLFHLSCLDLLRD